MGLWHHAAGSPDQWAHRACAMVWRRVYPGNECSLKAARTFPAYMLQGTGFSDDAEWIAGELVSNALKYTRSGRPGGWFGVEVGLSRDTAWISVRDLGGVLVPTLVPPMLASPYAESGRGLAAVAALASCLEVAGDASSGHTIRAVLNLTAEPTGPQP